MFYSETLLSRSGPLARVWLAANLERKLKKGDVVQSDLADNVNTIINTSQAPIALRLSGQLLLGVVRIYSRKARYLLDDCNEALTRIKLAFRPGNVDLPANQSHMANPESLLLQDTITATDILNAMPDPALLLAGTSGFGMGTQDPTLLDFGPSQLLSESVEEPPLGAFPGDDLGLEEEYSIEAGRKAPPGRTLADEVEESGLKFGEGDDLELDILDEPLLPPAPPAAESPTLAPVDDMDIDIDAGAQMDVNLDISLPEIARTEDDGIAVASPARQRATDSPLSERDITDLEQEFEAIDTTLEPTEEFIQQSQRAKRRRVLEADADTELRPAQIRAQQDDRSEILKPASFLPRDPVLLALMNMQNNGGFVSNILGDGRNQGWAPELRGILSVEVVRRSGNLKRKRDSGVADLGLSDEEPAKEGSVAPQLEFDQEDLEAGAGTFDVGGDTTLGGAAEIEELPAIAGRESSSAPEEEEEPPQFDDHFDETTMPLLHPEDAGPVSQGTVHAVHLLRQHFGDEAADSPSQRQKKAVQFQDLRPEETTSRSDATKMFFEVLVLATKDAIAVEKQSVETIGGPIKIRAKRGLWGAWAEAGMGTQTQQTEGGAVLEIEA